MPKKKIAGQNVDKMEPVATKKARTVKPAAGKPSKTLVTIDYPLDGEIVTSPVYTFRLTALEPRSVEVSLDGKEWRPCRESVGHWWYDWSGYQGGVYTLSARMTGKSGKVVKAVSRSFTVLI